MMTCTADFNVTAFSVNATAVEGNNHTLRCQYNSPDPVSTDDWVHVDWYKKQWGNSTHNVSHVHIWRARNAKNSTAINEAQTQTGYEPQLTGSSINFPEFLSTHSITFKRIELDDAGDFYCYLHVKIGQISKFEVSPDLHVDVIGKYIPRMQICNELKKKRICKNN